jgi:hypothetical protein
MDQEVAFVVVAVMGMTGYCRLLVIEVLNLAAILILVHQHFHGHESMCQVLQDCCEWLADLATHH